MAYFKTYDHKYTDLKSVLFQGSWTGRYRTHNRGAIPYYKVGDGEAYYRAYVGSGGDLHLFVICGSLGSVENITLLKRIPCDLDPTDYEGIYNLAKKYI